MNTDTEFFRPLTPRNGLRRTSSRHSLKLQPGGAVLKTTLVRIGLLLLLANAALADSIEGNWKTKSGETAAIAGCGGGFCITLKTGDYTGRHVGNMSPIGDGQYDGSITKPSSGKTYSGKASLSGNALKLKGSVFGGLICEIQTWSRL